MALSNDGGTMIEPRNAMLLPRKTRYLVEEPLHFLRAVYENSRIGTETSFNEVWI